MGFRFQRRLNFGSGLGLNLSKTGASPSSRTLFGSISARGFSVKTRVPGVFYRKSWGKGGFGLFFGFILGMMFIVVNLIVFLSSLFILLFVFFLQFAWVIIVLAFGVSFWLGLTAYDFAKYLIEKSHSSEKTE